MTDADWLAAIAAAPDDPLVRLAYADWLDDRGDARGELLRLDFALLGRGDGDTGTEPLRVRLAQLTTGADARWRAATCRVPVAFDGWFDEGFCVCEVPAEVAPGHFVVDEFLNHTLVRQPSDLTAVAALCAAARGCYGGALRYAGTDPVVIHMLGNDPVYCDHLIQDGSPTVQPAPPPQPPEPFHLPLPAVDAGLPPSERGTPWWLIAWGLTVVARLIYSAVQQER